MVKEGVQYLAGFYFTPDALAVVPILEQANVPMLVMNAGTSMIVTRSPLVVRTSFTMWQTSTPMAKVTEDKGIGKVVTIVSDYGRRRCRNRFQDGFHRARGTGDRFDPHAALDHGLQPDHAAGPRHGR